MYLVVNLIMFLNKSRVFGNLGRHNAQLDVTAILIHINEQLLFKAHLKSRSYSYAIEVWEWISNFIPPLIMDVITYSCWDLS